MLLQEQKVGTIDVAIAVGEVLTEAGHAPDPANEPTLPETQATFAAVEAAQFPLSRTLAFRESNLEVVSLINGPSDFDGVITDRHGDVRALWSSFAFDSGHELQQENFGIPSDVVTEMVDVVRSGRDLRSLEAELQIVPLSAARKLPAVTSSPASAVTASMRAIGQIEPPP